MNNFNKQNGQLMIIMAVLMAGLFVVGTAIAGLLMFFSASQSSDVISSNAAVFAANTGIEEALYCYFKNLTLNYNICDKPQESICAGNTDLPNGSSYSSYIKFVCDGNEPIAFKVKSVGKAASAERVLEQYFDLK